jgi:putative DNA primase/helicase
MRLAASSHGAMNLCRLAPLAYWETLYPSKRGVSWTAAASDLFSQQAAVGIFDLESLRGRGAWWDQGRSVLHLGDRLVVDGISQPVMDDFASQFHYQRGAVIHGPGKAVPLSDEEALLVLAIADRFHWDVPASAMVLAGWVALAPLSGVLSWRPHIWLTAAAGSGKSAILERFVGVLLGDLALPVVGNTTEAFIRQALRSDALPVVIDEAESNDKLDQQRIQQILALARYASSETRASIGKGSVAGEVQRFRVRSMFLLSSISTALRQGADRRRFSQLTLRNPGELAPVERQKHWEELDRDLDLMITPETGRRLIARTVSLIPMIRQAVKVFTKVAAAHFESQALGDQYGTLLAGAWALQSASVPTEQQARGLIASSDWSSYQQAIEVSDERRCLQTILEFQLRVDADERTLTRNVLELIQVVVSAGLDPLQAVAPRLASESLGRLGLQVRGEQLLIANCAEGLAQILRNTPWSSSWNTILSRLAGASRCEKPVHFPCMGTRRVVAVPLAIVTV